MLVLTIQFFFGVMLFGTLVAFLDEYVFKNIQGFKFRVFQVALFSVLMTCLIPLNILILSFIN